MNEDQQGCTHREHKGAAACNKLCDPGQDLCPFHKLLADNRESPTNPKPPQPARTHKTPRAYSQ